MRFNGSCRVLVLQLLALLFFGQHVRAFEPYLTSLQSSPRSSKKYASLTDTQVSMPSESSTSPLGHKYRERFSQQNRTPMGLGTRGRYGGLADRGRAEIAPIYRLDLERRQPENISPQNYQDGTIVSSQGIQMMAAPTPQRHRPKFRAQQKSEQKPQGRAGYQPKLSMAWAPPRYEPRSPKDFQIDKNPQDMRRPKYENPLALPMYQPKPLQSYNRPARVLQRFELGPPQVPASKWYEHKQQQRYEKPTRVLTPSAYEKLSQALPEHESKLQRMHEKPIWVGTGYEAKLQQNALPSRYETNSAQDQRPRSPKTRLRAFGSGLYPRH
ncbi:uncharacterized protein LOC130910224 [Corythoichthys intestinalis]|uniref:uncharacterized protein LOC130910224 n=1 Tax=Corythoichthys intestinalis TaxID=161448 RepID=UPI0025A51D77|nr:uncharacterized protein LOC130910224 [Corythoichthys intestinalis]